MKIPHFAICPFVPLFCSRCQNVNVSPGIQIRSGGGGRGQNAHPERPEPAVTPEAARQKTQVMKVATGNPSETKKNQIQTAIIKANQGQKTAADIRHSEFSAFGHLNRSLLYGFPSSQPPSPSPLALTPALRNIDEN